MLDEILAEASRLMKQGIGLRDEAPAEALACFDRALDLRRHLPIDELPVLRYDLAACWLNRAETLVDLGRGDEARQAYDEALALLQTLPLDEDPRFVRRLAIAWQNRGLVLAAAAPHASAMQEAIASFLQAIDVLDRHGASLEDRSPLLGAIRVNAANAWLACGDGESMSQAGRAARLAIGSVEAIERDDAYAADVGLQARHVLCRVLAASMHAIDDVHEATDLADDALSLVETWERRGVPHFRALAGDFLRFGAHVYATHQPRFLQEFIEEHLDPARSSPAYLECDEVRRAAQDIAALQAGTYTVRLAIHLE